MEFQHPSDEQGVTSFSEIVGKRLVGRHWLNQQRLDDRKAKGKKEEGSVLGMLRPEVPSSRY